MLHLTLEFEDRAEPFLLPVSLENVLSPNIRCQFSVLGLRQRQEILCYLREGLLVPEGALSEDTLGQSKDIVTE